MKKKGFNKEWAEIVAKAWMDERFKKELLSHPEKVLKEYGIDLPGSKFKVVEDTGNTVHLVLPKKPEGNLSEHELKNIAAAGFSDLTQCR